MLEIRISAPELAEAINNLARAIGSVPATPVVETQTPAVEASTPVAPAPVAPAPVVPTPAPVAPTPVAVTPVAVTPAVPTAAPQYTLEMIANAGTSLLDAGKIAELTALLAKYGIEALTSLDPAQYGAMAMDLRALGAQI